MENYKNIEFDLKLLETEMRSIHKNSLKIVSENLEEFNNRNPANSELKYKYHKRENGPFRKEEFGFDIINVNKDQINTASYFTPNWFIYISKELPNFTEWISHYSNRADSNFHKQMNRNGKSEIDLFIKLFKDLELKSCGFSKEQNEIFTSTMNEKCEIAKSYR